MSYDYLADGREDTKFVCHECVGEQFFSQLVRFEGTPRRCSYCDSDAMAISILDAADRVEIAFDQHYVRTSDQPDHWQASLQRDRESDYEWQREGETTADAIANAAMIDEEVANDIQEILADRHWNSEADQMGEETNFSGDAYYGEKLVSDVAWQEEWDFFERSLRTEARLFSRVALTHLSSVFSGVDALRTLNGQAAVISAGPGTDITSLYRARVFQSEGELVKALCNADREIGPPPSRHATAGRMNAKGISVFYGARGKATAISEVRPPVGSQVVVAKFEIVKPIRLLNLPALNSAHESGSVFDPDFAKRLERAVFLKSLTQRMTRPVMPDDQDFSYLATQAIADFLATDPSLKLDGIIFPSVQAEEEDALNVVLFHKAAKVEAISYPEGTEINARTGDHHEDGWEPNYVIMEAVPQSVKENSGSREFCISKYLNLTEHEPDAREFTLRILINAMEVHHIQKVKFETVPFEVQRISYQKNTDSFTFEGPI